MAQLMVETPERWAATTGRATEDGALKEAPDVSYEEMKKFVKDGKFTIVIPTQRQIQLELSLFNNVLEILMNRNWMVVRASKESGGFITSDHPVVLTWSDASMRGGFYGPGFGLTGTSVLFPVSHRLALIGTFEHPAATIDISDDGVAGFNGAQVAYAERQVYARDYNFRYSLQPKEAPRKASRLIDDKRFRKPYPRDEKAEPTRSDTE